MRCVIGTAATALVAIACGPAALAQTATAQQRQEQPWTQRGYGIEKDLRVQPGPGGGRGVDFYDLMYDYGLYDGYYDWDPPGAIASPRAGVYQPYDRLYAPPQRDVWYMMDDDFFDVDEDVSVYRYDPPDGRDGGAIIYGRDDDLLYLRDDDILLYEDDLFEGSRSRAGSAGRPSGYPGREYGIWGDYSGREGRTIDRYSAGGGFDAWYDNAPPRRSTGWYAD